MSTSEHPPWPTERTSSVMTPMPPCFMTGEKKSATTAISRLAETISSKSDSVPKSAKGMEVVLEAKTNASIKTNANLDLKATANLTAEGTAGTSLKTSALGEVSASGILTVKSAMVMIN